MGEWKVSTELHCDEISKYDRKHKEGYTHGRTDVVKEYITHSFDARCLETTLRSVVAYLPQPWT